LLFLFELLRARAAGGTVADEFEVAAADGPVAADANGGKASFSDENLNAHGSNPEFNCGL